MKLLLLNKPFRVLTRFRRTDERATLADFVPVPGVHPAGRLDYDSEGLLLLTDDGRLQSLITEPRHALEKIYWAQVEGVPDAAAIARLRDGVDLSDGRTRPAGAVAIAEPPGLWPRDPPIRHRVAIPTSWLELRLREGRNRQVRRMTAAVGHPTLRLVRAAIGPWTLAGLAPGEWRDAAAAEVARWRDELARAAGAAPPPERRRVGVSGPSGGDGRSASRPRAPARSSGAGPRWSGRPGRGPRR